MKPRKSCFQRICMTLSVRAFLLFSGVLLASGALQLEKRLPEGLLLEPTSHLTFSLFDSAQGVTPIAAQSYFPGEWEFVEETLRVTFDYQSVLDEYPEIWLVVESDGVTIGERELIRAVTTGVTFALGNTLNMDGNRITNLGVPDAGADAATMQFVLDEVGSFTEIDPTVPVSIKDGVSWSELSGIPAGFSDNVDNQGVTSVATGTGLTGGPISSSGTLSVQVPLNLTGSYADTAIINAENTTSESGGMGVSGKGNTAGGYFEDRTNTGKAWVGFGNAGILGEGTTYGGYFRDSDTDDSGYAHVGVADDGVFKDRRVAHIHHSMARIRATEVGRYIVRAMKNGITSIIGPEGQVITRSNSLRRALIKADVRLLDSHTVWTWVGKWPLILGALGFFGVWVLISRRR